MVSRIALLLKNGIAEGSLSVKNGHLEQGSLSYGNGDYDKNRHVFKSDDPARIELEISQTCNREGAYATVVYVRADQHAFSFFLRDVSADFPIYVREYGAIVTTAECQETYEQLVETIEGKRRRTDLQRIEGEAEESYEAAAQATRAMISPVWLGLSRDVRIFEAHFRGIGNTDNERMWDSVRPRMGAHGVSRSESDSTPVHYNYLLGRGLGCEYRISRRLEEGIFPIVHAVIEDGEVEYANTAFASLESSSLLTLKGTHYLVADQTSASYMFTPEQRAQYEELPEEWRHPREETVYYSRTIATNKAEVPRYAWFKSPMPAGCVAEFDGSTGFGQYAAGKVFAVSKLDGQPLWQEEIAVLLKPGQSVVFEFYIPHHPIVQERATRLREQHFEARHLECLSFWKSKLSSAAEIRLPEPRIQEMMQAGFMHLDLVSYGLEPDGTLLPAVGVYPGIGSESSPIIQYMDSIGAAQNAERSLQFFLDKQHESGLIQNYDGYMLETGAVLWSIGEHYRYTRDEEWLRRIKPKLLKSYTFIMQWRERNLREDLRGGGYGMLEGKTADPEDHFRSYMLNGYAYLGLKRLAETLAFSDSELSLQMAREARALRADIRRSLRETMARSPVVPLGDGSWAPSCAPWAEYSGPLSLYADGGKWGTHGSMVARDSMLGPLYLVFQEVLEPVEPEAAFLLHVHSELMCIRNVALSQPYYSIHPWVHLKRGEVKPFLKAFYNGLAGLADRDIYTFWEHYWHASPHKTHEEGWFLMQCRWMLYMEEGETLKLLRGVPRVWLEQGKQISLGHAVSYFGPISMRIESDTDNGRIIAEVQFHDDLRRAEKVEIRLPHPQGKRAIRTSQGDYHEETETVVLTVNASGTIQVILDFE
ncbi:hypothetical protein PAT3040_03585 [Paenibacillus agaridevorans]|uniref:Cellobiose phosphorylase n=1 Tax=Paenibacillus agaridevorans TaxID=171404 RepID=A0A2R5EVA0_9BACL|nr:hypothetical protein [Paenibacillus agaridevorans]GBG08968.1 hypothetical protein PAT3040_03585 [Paenibacillus agaridevorans]